jgi:hypothetical protein
MDDVQILCDGCGRTMLHDWITVNVVQNIIRKRMKQANDDKASETALG